MTPSDLEPYKVKLPYICITSVHDSQTLVRFALRPALFEIQATLRQVHRMTPNWPWTLQCQITLYYITTVPESQISLRFALQPEVLELQAILRHVHWMTSKWPWTLLGQRYTTYVLLVSPSPKFCSVLLYDQRFPWYSTFYNSCGPMMKFKNSLKIWLQFQKSKTVLFVRTTQKKIQEKRWKDSTVIEGRSSSHRVPS